MRVQVVGFCIVMLAGICTSVSPLSAQSLKRDGTIEIAGRSLSCSGVRIRLDRSIPSEGAAAPGIVLLNPSMLRSQPDSVRLFVFHHECGHLHVGESEMEADCWAIGRGVRDGWLDEKGLKDVCRSFDGMPETDTHPSAKRRCRNLDRCFAKAQARTQVAAAPPTAPQTAMPTLVRGPTLLSTGIVRYSDK
jgi:hypothetical protein